MQERANSSNFYKAKMFEFLQGRFYTGVLLKKTGKTDKRTVA